MEKNTPQKQLFLKDMERNGNGKKSMFYFTCLINKNRKITFLCEIKFVNMSKLIKLVKSHLLVLKDTYHLSI